MEQPKKLPWNIIDDEIVISGIGGRYPESDSLDEFRDNLYNNVDMITSDDRRWPTDLYGMTNRMGKLKEIDKFDASFFGIIPKVADEVDPQGRILLETTWESIIDAGYNPQQLRGSNTGVYVGYTSVAMPDGVPQQVQDDIQASKVESLLWFQGGSKAFYANRVSFLFDFHGPSMSIDIACASSMVCLNIAVTDLRLGKCDQAIVAGVSINLQPFTNHIYKVNNIAAPDGRSKVWDQSANGYVRGETVCSLFLQKKSDSKRIYATILHAKTNIDGYKLTGMFFPSAESQLDLMVQTYTEANVDPLKVNYFESHGTGTKAGDPQEAKAILEAYCRNRKDKLPIGLLKSNIGHGEGASGVASISKLCIVYENKCIPANLNLKKIKTDIASMVPPLDPVCENRSYEPGIAGINSFGIGGVNAHALVKPNQKDFDSNSFDIFGANNLPRIINLIGRQEESIEYLFRFIENNPQRITREFLALLNEIVNYEPTIYSAGFPYRGTIMIKKSLTEDNSFEYQKKISKIENVRRPICFFFSGMGSQWSGMAKAMMNIELFAATIDKCAKILKPFQIDLHDILLSEDPKALDDKVYHFVAISSVQIALIDLFTAMNVKPDIIIGHSFGEIACAYADGCLTLEQSIMTSYWRGKAVKDSNIINGMMAAVGLTWPETVKRCPKGVFAACHNSEDSVTISGSYAEVDDFIKQLTAEKIFAKEVQCANIPFHSPFLQPAVEPMLNILKNIIPKPMNRSEKWISTSVAENEWSQEKAQKASPEYFVNNLMNPVLLHEATKFIPDNAIIIELASHTLFQAIFKRSMPKCDYVGLMKRGNNKGNLDFYLQSLGQLYQYGCNVQIQALYPKVEWPVPRNTQSIGSLMRWDHSNTFLVKKYPEYHSQATASDFVSKFSLSNPDDQFLKDHSFDNKCFLPATSYLLMAWRRLAVTYGQPWFAFPVEFENVQFKRLISLTDDEIRLKVRLLDPTGEFIILDGNNIAASGTIRRSSNDLIDFHYQHLIDNFSNQSSDSSLYGHKLNTSEFYTEMNVRGYDYGPKFKQIKQIEFIDFNKSIATVKWTNNLITFVESMIQLSVSHTDKRLIYVSSSLPSFKCDPRLLFKNINDDNDQQQQQQPLIDDDRSIIIDSNLNFIASRGIEIQGLKFVSISQKNVMNDVKLEKYEFVPFEESKAIETIDYEQLRQYTNDCDLIMETILAINKKQTIESNDFINLRKILSKKSTLSDHHVLLQILIDVFNELVDENDNLTGKFMDKSMIQTIIDDNQYDLSNDLLEIQHKNHRLNRSSLDIINENSLRNLSVIEVNYNQQITIDDLLCHMNGYFHYPLVVDSIIMTKNDLNNDSKISSTHKLINWPNVFESKLPAIDAPVDLFIYRDSIDLIESINFDLFGKDIALNVKENGFVYGIFRLNYTKSEQTLMNLMEKSTNINDSTQADRIKQFESSMIANGFNLITKKSDSLSTVCMLFRKQIQQLLPEKQCSVPVYFGAFNEWVDQLKQSFTAYKNRPKNENIWIVADDNNFNGILGMTNCLRQEPGGDRFRCIFSDRKLPQPIDFNRSPYNEIMRKDLSMNVYKNGKWGTYRLLDLEHDYNQIRCEDYYLDILKKADMTTMKWIVNDISNRSESIRNDRKLVNVQIHFSGIDGKDLLIANGNNNNDDERSLGTEFSGYRTDTKEPVMGLTYQRSIATSINVDERFLLPVPNNWELDDAAASIYSFFIAWYSLIEQAKLQPNETILINPGCSPNGLAALQIAQQMKCKIIITANSDEKRKYLMENCDLNDCDCHVLNSMDSNFTDQLMIRTSFKGVDIVFNSLSMNNANDHMRNLSKIINDYGRFIDVDHNSNPKFQSSNVNYFNISPTLMSLNTFENIMPKLLKNFRVWFDQFGKQLKPLPRMIFDRNSYQQAFTTLNRDENIGKILIQIRNDNGSQRIMAKPRTSFVANKCYILVGGLGGLGLEIAYWLAKRGARKLVLVSRSGIKNEYQYVFVKRIENILKNQENEKIQIKISTSDPTTMKGAEQLLLESQELGPIGGLFHFATVLSDAFIEDQTPESFAKVCAPKMVALGNLDRLTRKLCPDIDYFVAFSSQSSARGFLGQNNYGYANSVMERICEKRCEDGLAGQAIAYGPIGDVGLWAQNEHVDLTSIGMVINTQRLTSCMEVLDRLLPLKQYPIVTSIVRIENQQQSGNNTNVKDHIWQGIGIDMDSLPDNLSLGDVGMESILAVEMQQRIEREYEVVLTSDEIKKLTVGMIKEYRKSDKESIKKSLTEFHNNNK